jgi:predicted transcriptional regulator
LARLIEEFGFTHEQAAKAVGKSRSAISNLLRLAQLAKPVQAMLLAGDIDMGHARLYRCQAQVRLLWHKNCLSKGCLFVRQKEWLLRWLLPAS